MKKSKKEKTRRRRADRRLAEALDQLAKMPPKDAAEVLRRLISEGHDREVSKELLARIAERAAEGAPEAGRAILRRYAETYRAGRLVKWGSAQGVLMQEGETSALVADVESSFPSDDPR